MKANLSIIYDNDSCSTKVIADSIMLGVKSINNVECNMYSAGFAINNPAPLLESDAIIFGSPTYFGNVSARTKSFMDSTTDIWKYKKWKNKIAAAFTHSSAISGDKLSTLLSIFIFAQQHGMIWVGLDIKSRTKIEGGYELNKFGSWVGLMTESLQQNNQMAITDDLRTAQYFGARIAKLTKTFKK